MIRAITELGFEGIIAKR
jgi:ATP-dependent DNA ligase